MAGSRLLGNRYGVSRARSAWFAVAALVSAAFLAGCCLTGGKSEPADSEVAQEEVVFSLQDRGRPQGVFEDYRIHPGDTLDVLYHVQAWQERDSFVLAVDHAVSVKFPLSPNLNEMERVRPDGRISLPYLGEVQAAGKTIEELTAELKQRYKGVLRSPELYIAVPEFRSAIRELKQDLHTGPRGQSRLVTVRPDGCATFAMLGDIFVAGQSVPAVASTLNKRYLEVLPGLAVDVFVESREGPQIYVLGRVDNPGAYRIPKPTPVSEALALAGSPLADAELGSVVVMRRHGDRIIARRINAKPSLGMRRHGKKYVVQADDIVYVPRETARLDDLARDLRKIPFFRGWGIGVDNGNTAGEESPEAVVGP